MWSLINMENYRCMVFEVFYENLYFKYGTMASKTRAPYVSAATYADVIIC